MIARRQFISAATALSAGAAIMPARLGAASAPAPGAIAVLDPLETMVRLRARTDGELSIAWLDAQREFVMDGEIKPFCSLHALVLTKFRKSGKAYAAETVEITYYCDPTTGELLETALMPGASEPVDVPIYRAGPTQVRFMESLDEWEQHDPAESKAATAAFAPPSWVHLVRGVHKPSMRDDEIYVRADEYGRAYADRTKPPSVWYREWIVWKGNTREILETANPDVASDFSYAAMSSLRPWMKMGAAQAHTTSNGRGAKVASLDGLPTKLTQLLLEHDPKALDQPAAYFE